MTKDTSALMDRRISPLTKAIAWLFAGAGLLVIIGMVWEGRESDTRAPADPAAAAMLPEEPVVDAGGEPRAIQQRSPEQEVFGNAQCKALILQDLHDPNSVRWEPADSWGWVEQGDGLVLVQPRFRARNPAGAYVPATMDCYLDTKAGTVSPVRDASLLMPRAALTPPHPTP